MKSIVNNGKVNQEQVKSANRQYYNIAATDYMKNEAYAYTDKIRHDVKEILLRHFKPEKNGVFLDVGCGSGFLSKIVIENSLAESCIGVDISDEQIEIYNQTVSQGNAIRCDACDLDLADNSIDYIGGYSVLHHFYDYYKLLNEVERVLKPGGVMYFDFEPNSIFKKLFHYPIMIRRKLFDQEARGENDLEALAEYHNNYQPGIDMAHMIKHLNLHFDVLEHGARYPDNISGKIASFFTLKSIRLSPLFYIVLKKR